MLIFIDDTTRKIKKYDNKKYVSDHYFDRYCTSIVSQDSKGQIWHSRNLDYGFTDMLKNITVAVDFQTGGKASINSFL